MIDKSSDELEDYFENLSEKARKVKGKVSGKSGLTFIFYYLGHGVMLDGFTHIVLNEVKK